LAYHPTLFIYRNKRRKFGFLDIVTECRTIIETWALKFSLQLHLKGLINYETGGKKKNCRFRRVAYNYRELVIDKKWEKFA
jgi:hypothetical protein